MTGLALWLAVVALLDLARTGRTLHGVRPLVLAALPALVVLVVVAVAAGPHGGGWVAWAVGVVGLLGWVLGTAEGWSTSGHGARAWQSSLAFGAFGATLLAFLVAGPRAGDASFLEHVVTSSALGATVDAQRVLTVVAVALAQFGTANLLVRLLLERLGVPAPDHEKRLRGGRFLGPMERLLIVGLAVGGSLDGAAVVVAAKALLRFPEVRASASLGKPGGATDVTEYFLVGSLASWIVAFGGVALLQLT